MVYGASTVQERGLDRDVYMVDRFLCDALALAVALILWWRACGLRVSSTRAATGQLPQPTGNNYPLFLAVRERVHRRWPWFPADAARSEHRGGHRGLEGSAPALASDCRDLRRWSC